MNSDYFINVNDIHVPDYMYNPYKLDNDVLNNIFSDLGGIIPTQLILLTGMPGSGKTTLAGYIGSRVSDFVLNNPPVEDRPHGPVVLISREMSEFQIKLLSLQVANFGDIVLLKPSAKIDEISNWISDIISLDPSLIILDSIQQLAKEIKGSIGAVSAATNYIITLFTEIARQHRISVILIGHVNKTGEFKGNNELQHDIDTHIHINIDKSTNEREIVIEKNRFGNISKTAIMRLEENCISITSNFMDSTLITDKTYNEIVGEFHKFNNEKARISHNSVQITFAALLEHLKAKYEAKLEKANRPLGSIKIFFTQGKKCYTDLSKNSIFIGFDDLRTITANTASVYPTENSYMNLICKTREDHLLWILLQNFANLLYGNSKDDYFFQKLYKLANENIELFSPSNL